MTFGVIDIGTNSILYLKASVSQGDVEIVFDRQLHHRAGRWLDAAGNISPEYKAGMSQALVSALDALGDCSKIVIVATEVLRKPADGQKYAEVFSEQIGHRIQIIDPYREAELSFSGASADIQPGGGMLAVIDVGGGSTELSVGGVCRLDDWASMEFGAVVACEKSGYEKPASEYIDVAEKMIRRSALFRLFDKQILLTVAVGGSAVAMAALLLGQSSYNMRQIHNSTIRRADLAALLDQLSRMTIIERKRLMTFDSERADIIVGGGAILLAFMRIFALDTLNVSTKGLRYGLLRELVE